MRVAVAGLWHLGTVTAACLASAGYSVIGFDENVETISGLQKARLPVFEPGLEDLIRRQTEVGRLRFSGNPEDLTGVEIIWVAYDTPLDEEDLADVEYVIERPAFYRMLPQMGPPETTIREYPTSDRSWELECAEFVQDIRLGRQPAAGLCDAQATLQVVERIYKVSGV